MQKAVVLFTSWLALAACASAAEGITGAAADGSHPKITGQLCIGGGQRVVGEAIVATFRVHNGTDTPLYFSIGPGKDGFSFSARDADGNPCRRRARSDGGGEVPVRVVAPNGWHEQTIVVDRYVILDKPGSYTVDWSISLQIPMMGGEDERPTLPLMRGTAEVKLVQPEDEDLDGMFADILDGVIRARESTEDRILGIKRLAFSASTNAMRYVKRALLEVDEPVTRSVAVRSLREAGTDAATDVLLDLLRSGDVALKKEVIPALAVVKSRKAELGVLSVFDDESPELRRIALEAIAWTGSQECVAHVRRRTLDSDDAVRKQAEKTLRILRQRRIAHQERADWVE